jgi:hypothetical protein
MILKIWDRWILERGLEWRDRVVDGDGRVVERRRDSGGGV